ncbi:hypothetical protein F4694_005768 [Bacillus niacini]|uniref:Uncharacterized protein n=1 Tax=Neobacillus niacini TaxID=86668 RepID=A0A852TL71_9BACI|nr:hypothetical protein [Neobacillus niacini]
MAEVKIGHYWMIGPNVGIYTSGHSIEPKDRNKSGYGNQLHFETKHGLVEVVLSSLESLLAIIQLLLLVLLLQKMFLLIQ